MQKIKDCKILWQEVKKDGTLVEKSYSCSRTDAMWHMVEMRKSPSVIINPRIKK
jgi:hypothetical protein